MISKYSDREDRQQFTSVVDFTTNNGDFVFCNRCSNVRIKSRLNKRILEDNEPVPADYDQWLQCHVWGKIVSINNIKHTSKLMENIDLDNKPIFLSMERIKRKKKQIGISRIKDSKLGLKDKHSEINELIRKDHNVTVHH